MRSVGHLLLVIFLLGCCGGEQLALHLRSTIHDTPLPQEQDVMLLAIKYRQDIQERVDDLQLCGVHEAAQEPIASPFHLAEPHHEIGLFRMTALDPLYSFMSMQL
jgi:hypothetical protein